jgi:cytochrome P450
MPMDLSLRPQQRPEHRMHTVTIEEIVSLGDRWDDRRPALEQYFSPTRRTQFEKDYIHYLNTLLLEVKHGNLDLDLYLVFVLTFQFIAPLLGIPVEKELGLFYKILEQRYDVDEMDINLHFSTYEGSNKMIGEEEALSAFRQELDATWEGRREVKERVQKRLKQDGIRAIMRWQQEKDFPELAEAFGRSVVIPSFFSFRDRKLLGFYQSTTEGITYEVAVPEM